MDHSVSMLIVVDARYAVASQGRGLWSAIKKNRCNRGFFISFTALLCVLRRVLRCSDGMRSKEEEAKLKRSGSNKMTPHFTIYCFLKDYDFKFSLTSFIAQTPRYPQYRRR